MAFIIRKTFIVLVLSLFLAPQVSFANASYSFDEVDDYIEADSYQASTAVSICVWVKPSVVGTAFRTWVGLPHAATHTSPYFKYHLGQNGNGAGRVVLLLSNATTIKSAEAANNTLEVDVWQFYCGIWDKSLNSGKPEIYKNGVEVSYAIQNAKTDNIATSTQNVRYGTNVALGEDYAGLMSHPMIFNKKLTGAEMFQLYRCPTSIPNGLLSHLYLMGNARDYSGNGHHGTVTGATASTDGPPVSLGCGVEN